MPTEKLRDLPRTILAIFVICGLIGATFLVVQPFLAATIWAATLVIATWPLLLRVQAACAGRRGLAVTFMTLCLLLIVLLPLSVAIGAIAMHADQIMSLVVGLPDFRLPPPPHWLGDIPLIGEPAVEQWLRIAGRDFVDLAKEVKPYIGTITLWFGSAAGGAGALVMHLLVTIAIAAVLYARGEVMAGWLIRFGRRLAGPQGAEAVVLAGQAIRSVALGVVVTAVAQTFVAGVGLAAAGVPRAGLLSAVILLLSIAQLGPALVLIPATIWLFVSGATVSGIVLAIFTVLALTMDNFLRPFLIKRGADLPLLLILTGVIGGMLSFGLLGLFLGPVVLAVVYTLLQHWVDET